MVDQPPSILSPGTFSPGGPSALQFPPLVKQFSLPPRPGKCIIYLYISSFYSPELTCLILSRIHPSSYPESMTDPSYRSQILVFTTPMIGNYGIPPNVLATSPIPVPSSPDLFLESDRVQCSGVVVAELADRFSHYQAMESISSWCHRFGVPGITGVDTRAITSLLRQQGSTLAKIAVGDGHQTPVTPDQYWDPSGINLVAEASTKAPYTLNPTSPISIAMLDFGAKANIARSLVRHGAAVTVLPWDTPASSIIGKYHGLFLSNGPGDPKHAVAAVNTVRTVINDAPNMPIFGICMGRSFSTLSGKSLPGLLNVLCLP